MPLKWCSACCKVVDTVIKETAPLAIAPLVGALAGTAHGATRRRPSMGDVLVKAGLGLATGFVVQSLASKAQQIVCKDCGCSHLSDQAAA